MNKSKAAWWIGSVLLIGATFAGLHRVIKFEVDFDPWDDAYLY
ncbi:MAG: hypothetical protein ABI667_09190 [Sphingomicrobium sp.]